VIEEAIDTGNVSLAMETSKSNKIVIIAKQKVWWDAADVQVQE
jgi:hypothetical protein